MREGGKGQARRQAGGNETGGKKGREGDEEKETNEGRGREGDKGRR